MWQEYERQTKPSTLTWKSLQLAPEERVAACMQKLPRMCAAGEAQPPRPCAMTRVAARGWSRTRPPALPCARRSFGLAVLGRPQRSMIYALSARVAAVTAPALRQGRAPGKRRRRFKLKSALAGC